MESQEEMDKFLGNVQLPNTKPARNRKYGENSVINNGIESAILQLLKKIKIQDKTDSQVNSTNLKKS